MKIKYLIFLFFSLFACKNDSKTAQDNTVYVRLGGEPDQLNPVLSTVDYGKQVEWQLFMPLLQYDAETLDLSPVLAKSRPKVESIQEGIYAGGRKYTFELRPEAKWDDGQPVLAKDFVFTLKTYLHPEIGFPGLRAFLGFIKIVEIDASNPRRFTVSTDRPINLAEEVIGTMAIYPAHLYDLEEILAKHSLATFINQDLIKAEVAKDTLLSAFADQFKKSGYSSSIKNITACGPYKLTEWLSGQRIRLEKKSDWWGAKLLGKHYSFSNHPDNIVYRFVKDDATLSSLLKEQKIDVASAIDPVDFKKLQENELMQQNFDFYTPISPSYSFISFNSKNEKLEDRRTRQAISHLVDVKAGINLAMKEYAIRTTGPILPAKSYYHQGLSPIEFNIEKAKQLLEEAGWVDQNQDGILEKEIAGTEIDFSMTYKYTNDNLIAEQIGLLLKNNAIKAGILINLIPLERKRLIDDTRARDFDLYFSSWSQRPGLDDLRTIWHTASDTPRGFNKAGFGNAKTDALIDSINIVSDEKIRTRMYREIQEIIYEERPYIFLFVPTERIVIHKRFDTKVTALRPGYLENTFRLEE